MPLSVSKITRKDFVTGVATALLLSSLPKVSPARAAAIGVTEIAPGVFVHQGRFADVSPDNAGDIANLSFIVGTEAVAVIDTGGSAKIGLTAKDAIAAVTPLPVRYVINTHMHPDHVFGNAAFKSANTAFVAHHKMARGLATRAEGYLARNKEWMGDDNFAGTEIVLPTQAIAEKQTLDLGGRTLTLQPRATAHTDNDMTIFDEATGTLFTGDLIFANRVPTIDGSIVGWLKVLAELKTEQAQRIVPGHGPTSMALGDGITPLDRYLKAIASDVRAAIKDGKTLASTVETAALSEKDNWLLFDEHHKRNVTAAFAELEWE